MTSLMNKNRLSNLFASEYLCSAQFCSLSRLNVSLNMMIWIWYAVEHLSAILTSMQAESPSYIHGLLSTLTQQPTLACSASPWPTRAAHELDSLCSTDLVDKSMLEPQSLNAPQNPIGQSRLSFKSRSGQVRCVAIRGPHTWRKIYCNFLSQ